MWSLSECIPWMTVGLLESIAILTLNLCTIIVFIRNRNLRKRSMYLVINLALIDMFVAGTVVYSLFYFPGIFCNLWKWDSIEDWTRTFINLLLAFLPFASLINISIIALERVHATFYPFRHRVLKKRVYGLLIAVVWVISGLLIIASSLLVEFGEEAHHYGYSVFLVFPYISLLIICVSYTSIGIKVRCGVHPQHHGAASRERKLSMTLLIVTVVSLLLYLPHVTDLFATYISKGEIWWSLPPSVVWHLYTALLFLLYLNSLVNPILYAIRMPEFRSALLALFRKRRQHQRQVAGLPLRDV